MSKNIRNLTCLIFSLGLILSLAVCGNAAGSTESNSSSAPSEQPGSQAAAADDKTTTEQMNEPIANDTVFVGAPVWWGDWPMIMYTFFEENAEALSGKTLVPFSTHEGSGLSGFDKKLSAAIPESSVLKGLATRGNDCQNKQGSVRKSVNDWIAGLGVKRRLSS